MQTAKVFAMRAFQKLDERLEGENKTLANAMMSLMLYVAHTIEKNGRANWWDNQMAGEAILEIVATGEVDGLLAP